MGAAAHSAVYLTLAEPRADSCAEPTRITANRGPQGKARGEPMVSRAREGAYEPHVACESQTREAGRLSARWECQEEEERFPPLPLPRGPDLPPGRLSQLPWVRQSVPRPNSTVSGELSQSGLAGKSLQSWLKAATRGAIAGAWLSS